MNKIGTFLALVLLTSSSFAQNTPQSVQPNTPNKSQILTSKSPLKPVKAMLYLDKLDFSNQDQFKKNIPISKMNVLIDGYVKALRGLTQTTQENEIKLEVTYNKDSQSFNLTSKNKPTEPELYKQVVTELEKVERPPVNNKLKLTITGHIVPVKN